MSIISEFNKTVRYTEDAKKAIIYRGGELSSTSGLKDLSESIINIPADGSLGFYTDTSTAYSKEVPDNSEKYALIGKIGGMSYKSENLIPYPFSDSNKNLSGIDVTTNNGIITLNGTYTGELLADFHIFQYGKTVLPSGTYTVSGCETGSANTYRLFLWVKKASGADSYISQTTKPITFTINDGDYIRQFSVRIAATAGTLNNIIIAPMIVSGSTEQSFSPYYQGLRDSKVIELTSRGVNLIKDDVYNFDNWKKLEESSNYVFDFEPNEEGMYAISCTADTTNANIYFYIQLSKYGGKYTSSGAILHPTYGVNDGYFVVSGTPVVPMYLNHKKGYKWRFWLNGGTPEKLAIVQNLQLEKVAEYNAPITAYTPYRAPASYPVPLKVQSLDGYGLGVNSTYYNYIEFRNSRVYYIQNCIYNILNGSEDWNLLNPNETTRYFYIGIYPLNTVKKGNIISNLYNSVTISTNNTNKGIYITNSSYGEDRLLVRPDDYLDITVEQFKERLTQTPLEIVCTLQTPIETDITDLFDKDNFIEVYAGGHIIFANKYENVVPSTIKYVIKTGV